MNSTSELANPPITEVVCGFILDPLPLTTLDFGVYRDARASDFQRYELHPPIMDAFAIQLTPMMDARVWLVSSDEESLVQLQNDRLYVNWRQRGDHYPRFHDHGERTGIKRRAIDEFERFDSFAKDRGISNIQVIRLELAKINILRKGIHYNIESDLYKIIPISNAFKNALAADLKAFDCRFSEGNDLHATHIAISMNPDQTQIEIRHLFPFTGVLDSDFTEANELVNQAFFRLLDIEFLEGVRS